MQHLYKRAIVLLAALLWLTNSAAAQSEQKFKTRLSPVPALGIQPATVAGVGTASATLTGRKVTVIGSFEKMASPATVGHLCLGQLPGVRGESVFDLTPEQIEALKKGRFYVQIHSDGAPNGHLLGWLLK